MARIPPTTKILVAARSAASDRRLQPRTLRSATAAMIVGETPTRYRAARPTPGCVNHKIFVNLIVLRARKIHHQTPLALRFAYPVIKHVMFLHFAPVLLVVDATFPIISYLFATLFSHGIALLLCVGSRLEGKDFITSMTLVPRSSLRIETVTLS